MSESKHTPGPWFVKEYEDKYYQSRNWRRIVTVKNKPGNIEIVPVIKWEFEDDRDGVYGGNAITKADARLIAAAPELLEALVCLLDQCEENERNKANFMGTSTFSREQANKAIQKARGQG